MNILRLAVEAFLEGYRGTVPVPPTMRHGATRLHRAGMFNEPKSLRLLLSQDEHTWLRRNNWVLSADNVVTGRFRTRAATIVGMVTYRPADIDYLVHVHKPPQWFVRSAFHHCIWHKGDGWYLLHQNSCQNNAILTICATEVLVQKAYEEHRAHV